MRENVYFSLCYIVISSGRNWRRTLKVNVEFYFWSFFILFFRRSSSVFLFFKLAWLIMVRIQFLFIMNRANTPSNGSRTQQPNNEWDL